MTFQSTMNYWPTDIFSSEFGHIFGKSTNRIDRISVSYPVKNQRKTRKNRRRAHAAGDSKAFN